MCSVYILETASTGNIQPVSKVAATFAIFKESKNIHDTVFNISKASKEQKMVMHSPVCIFIHIYLYVQDSIAWSTSPLHLHPCFFQHLQRISYAFAKHAHTTQLTPSSPSFSQITHSLCGEANITSINPAHFICLGNTTSRMKLALHANYSPDYKPPGTRCTGESCAPPVRISSCAHLLEGTCPLPASSSLPVLPREQKSWQQKSSRLLQAKVSFTLQP